MTLTAVGIPGQVITVPVTLAVGNTFAVGNPEPVVATCDVNDDSAIDRADIEVIFRDRGMVASASDARDADLDGFITTLDAAACADRCSLPDCRPAPTGCGLLGPELLPLVALTALLRRRARRRTGRGLAALLLASGLVGGSAESARALSLVLEPAESQVAMDQEVALDLIVSGLDSTPGAPLRSFDLSLSFDVALLGFIEAIYGDALGTVEANQVLQETRPGDSSVNLAAVSLLSAGNLVARQSDSFLLATLIFRTRGEAGTATVSLGQALMGSVSGQALATGSASARIDVIPEPGTALLVGFGLALVASKRLSKRTRGR